LKDEIDWVFRSDRVTLAFTVSEKQYCKTLYYLSSISAVITHHFTTRIVTSS